MRTAAAAAAAVLALASAPARADDEALARIDQSVRWEGAFGIRVGTFHVGPFDGFAFGFHLDGGVRLDRLFLYGEYSYMGISNTPPAQSDQSAMSSVPIDTKPQEISGIVQRVGANARYSLGKLASNDIPIRGDFWIEGGVGEQLVRWDRGGELHRPDLSFGFGGQFSARLGHAHDHRAGFYYALKATFAHAPAAYLQQTKTCAGPCDTPTGPIPVDRSFLFNMGIVFGN